MLEPWRVRLLEAEAACKDALADPDLESVQQQVGAYFPGECDCFKTLSAVTRAASTAALQRYSGLVTTPPGTFERWLLLRAALVAMPRIANSPVFHEVKSLWADDVIFFAHPPPVWASAFSLESVRFREMARIASLRRFPAGQFHWQRSGVPRSHLLRFPKRRLPRVIVYLLREMGGRAPLVETHENARRKNRLTFTDSEAQKSYYRLARSLELQPEVKGLCTCSWLYCAQTGEVTPRLAWLREFFLRNGALITDIGIAPPDSGFMVGCEERRRAYEEGWYRPRLAYVLWSRRAILSWAMRYDSSFNSDVR